LESFLKEHEMQCQLARNRVLAIEVAVYRSYRRLATPIRMLMRSIMVPKWHFATDWVRHPAEGTALSGPFAGRPLMTSPSIVLLTSEARSSLMKTAAALTSARIGAFWATLTRYNA
jgi:hypothetical protein